MSKGRKRTILAYICAGIMIIGTLSGCGGGGAEKAPTAQPTEALEQNQSTETGGTGASQGGDASPQVPEEVGDTEGGSQGSGGSGTGEDPYNAENRARLEQLLDNKGSGEKPVQSENPKGEAASADIDYVPVKVRTHVDQEYIDGNDWEDSTKRVYIEHPEIHLDENAPKAALNIADELNSKWERDAAQRYSEKLGEGQAAKGEYQYYYYDTVSPVRSDSEVLSFTERTQFFSASMDSYLNVLYSGNYDLRTGEEIMLYDLVKDSEVLADLVRYSIEEKYITSSSDEEFRKKYDQKALLEEVTQYIEDMSRCSNAAYAIDYLGLRFIFILDSVPGLNDVDVLVPYSSISRLLTNHAYEVLPGDYITELDTDQTFKINTENGEKVLRVIPHRSMEYGYDSFTGKATVYWGDADTAFDLEAYSFDVYLAHVVDNYYLYVSGGIEGGGETVVLLLGDKSVKETARLDMMMDNRPTDIFHIPLVRMFWEFGTFSATQYYHLGYDGEPVDNGDPYLDIDRGSIITAKRDLELNVLPDENSEITSKVTIPKGTKLTRYRTDGVDIIDFIMEDGRLVRLHFDEKPGGYEEEEAFYGILYAG